MARRRPPPPTIAETCRALQSHEVGGTPKAFGSAWPIAFCYPNTYHVGMSSLGFQILVDRISSRPDMAVERFFWDVSHPEGLGGHRRRPHGDSPDMDYAGSEPAGQSPAGWPQGPPLSIENQRRMDECAAICFSVAFEMDYLHIIDMLARSGLEPWAANRRGRDPIVIIGGAAVTMNRLPVYDFADVIVHGDGEAAVDALADAIADAGANRDGLLGRLRSVPGFELTSPRKPGDGAYDPSPPVTVSRLSVADRLMEYPAHSRILTPFTEFSSRGLIELSRGCPYKCDFCIMGYQPFRYQFRPPEEIERQARTYLTHTNRVGLVASAVGVHKQIEEVCDRLIKLDMNISFSSLRVEDVKPRMIDALLHSGQRTLTIAPEAGNDRMRIRMRKKLTNARIIEFLSQTVARGMPNVKLYYMIGVRDETDEDVASIAGLTRELHAAQVDASRPLGRIGHLALNVGVFVPKPGTPQRAGGFIGVKEARRRLRLLQGELKGIPNLKVHFSNPHMAASQTVLSCGDRRAADYLFRMWSTTRNDWRGANREFAQLLAECAAPVEAVPDNGSMASTSLAGVG